MNVNPRLIRHLVFALSLTLIPILCYSIIMYFGGKQGNPMYIGIFAVILSLNSMYSFFILKYDLVKKFAYAFTANFIGYLLTSLLIRVGINVENDIWGILKWLIGNAIFTIMLWEVIYQITRDSLISSVE